MNTEGLDPATALEMLDVVRAQYAYMAADLRSLRGERDHLRAVIEALLGVLGKTISADEIAKWRSLAHLPEAP